MGSGLSKSGKGPIVILKDAQGSHQDEGGVMAPLLIFSKECVLEVPQAEPLNFNFSDATPSHVFGLQAVTPGPVISPRLVSMTAQ